MHSSDSIRVEVGALQVVSPGVDLREVLVDAARGQVAPFQAALFNVFPGNVTIPERHAVREMWFALAGSGWVRTEFGDIPLDAGQVAYLEGGLEHSAVNRGENTLSILTIWWPAVTSINHDKDPVLPELIGS